MKRSLELILTAVFAGFCGWTGLAGEPADPCVSDGWREPTPEEREWERRNAIRVRRVKLNALGLERVNASRRGRGLPPLEAAPAPLGEEIEGQTDQEAASAPAPAAAPAEDPGLPTYVDNSTLKYFPPVRSQGSLLSCVQFSGIYYVYTHNTALARDWDAKNGGDTYRFSPKWTYNMINGGENVGSNYSQAYGIPSKHGCATWAEFPYDTNYRQWCLNPAVWRNAINHRSHSNGTIGSVDQPTGLANLKQMLVDGYIVNYLTYVTSWQYTTVKDDPATSVDNAFVGQYAAHWVNGYEGGHGMTVVGYNDDLWIDVNGNGTVDAGEKGALRIVNSWGTGWKNGGFCWVAYDALKATSAVAGGPTSTSRNPIFRSNLVYWIKARASYTPSVVAQFTLNHLKRNQLRMTLGIGETTSTTPATIWYPSYVLSYAGGPYAFDGTTTAVNGTFYFDFTDLVPTTTVSKRWHVGMYDNAAGDVATISSFKLYQVGSGGDTLAGTSANTPKTADGGQQVYVWVDYTYNPGNVAPVASGQSVTTAEDTPKAITLSATDANGDTLSYIIVSGPSHGSLSGSGASRTYTPAANYNGADSFTFKANDGKVDSNVATVSITVTAVNDPPTIGSSSPGSPFTMAAGSSQEFYVVASDADGDPLSYAWKLDGAAVGTNSASYTYSPTVAGTYTLSVTASDGKGGTVSHSWTVTVTANPAITLSPTTLAPNCTVGANAASQSFTVTNTGGETLSWTVSDNVTWLSCSPTSGTSTGEADTVTVSYTTSALAVGTHSATITVAGGTGVTSKTVAVTLTVTAAPVITLSPATLAPSCRKTTNAASQSFTVTNTGGGTLSWTVSDTASWLSCSPTSGTSTGEADTVTVTYATSGLAEGTYGATITVAGGSGVTSKTIAVTLTVTKPGKIKTSVTSLAVSCKKGSSPAASVFTVENEGVGTMAYTISEVCDWVAVSPSAGDVSAEADGVTASYSAGTLAVGTYAGTITIAAPEAENSPVTIPVTLTVKKTSSSSSSGGGCSLSGSAGPAGAAGWLLPWAAALAAWLVGRRRRGVCLPARGPHPPSL